MKPAMPENDALIDEALNSVPLAPLPAGFIRSTMQRVAHAGPRFRLDFLDIALPAFLAMFLLTIGIAGLWLLNLVNPLWLQLLLSRLEWLALFGAARFDMSRLIYSLGLAAGAAMLIAAGAATFLRPPGSHPARRINQ